MNITKILTLVSALAWVGCVADKTTTEISPITWNVKPAERTDLAWKITAQMETDGDDYHQRMLAGEDEHFNFAGTDLRFFIVGFLVDPCWPNGLQPIAVYQDLGINITGSIRKTKGGIHMKGSMLKTQMDYGENTNFNTDEPRVVVHENTKGIRFAFDAKPGQWVELSVNPKGEPRRILKLKIEKWPTP